MEELFSISSSQLFNQERNSFPQYIFHIKMSNILIPLSLNLEIIHNKIYQIWLRLKNLVNIILQRYVHIPYY